MADLVECLDLTSLVESAGYENLSDFESIYDDIATSGRHPLLKSEIESRVWKYFKALDIPQTPTLYDYLVLSLRQNDYIATFNWDPFLVKAYVRNSATAKLPRLIFLHGNVMVGICPTDRTSGFLNAPCRKCGGPLQPTRLLYPVRNKNYNCDPYIAGEWRKLSRALSAGYMLTIFGYGAPATDIEAVELMRKGWGDNPSFELAEVGIVDIRPEDELRPTWEQFLCRTHYSMSTEIWNTWLFRSPRRSCESFAMATLQNDPWPSNPYPRLNSLAKLQAWIAPLVEEERHGRFTGNACIQPEDFVKERPEPIKRTGIDWVLSWLKTMCKGELIPPFCVELALTDGAHYNLHSVLRCEDSTRTMVVRIWDLRALDADEIRSLKQRLNIIGDRSELADEKSLNPKLDWANLHLHYDDLSYCIEWHDRIWPEDESAEDETAENL